MIVINGPHGFAVRALTLNEVSFGIVGNFEKLFGEMTPSDVARVRELRGEGMLGGPQPRTPPPAWVGSVQRIEGAVRACAPALSDASSAAFQNRSLPQGFVLPLQLGYLRGDVIARKRRNRKSKKYHAGGIVGPRILLLLRRYG
jgi:hypothetical protein